jgi:hypothetical protein
VSGGSNGIVFLSLHWTACGIFRFPSRLPQPQLLLRQIPEYFITDTSQVEFTRLEGRKHGCFCVGLLCSPPKNEQFLCEQVSAVEVAYKDAPAGCPRRSPSSCPKYNFSSLTILSFCCSQPTCFEPKTSVVPFNVY